MYPTHTHEGQQLALQLDMLLLLRLGKLLPRELQEIWNEGLRLCLCH